MDSEMRIVVVADDITGAAELAGIAFSHGLSVCFACGNTMTVTHSVTVIATDTRSMTEVEAVAETRAVAARLASQAVPFLLFKKTDSALRGHVVAELGALMAVTGLSHAVYLPANPSKGRIIRQGVYYINGEAIDQTDFRFDPEFPARSAMMTERFPEAATLGITMPDATQASDIQEAVDQADADTILAGGGDLFEALIKKLMGDGVSPITNTPTLPSALPLLLLCGSTQSKVPAGMTTAAMPLKVYNGDDDLKAWLSDAATKYEQYGKLALSIPHHHRTGRDVAVRMRRLMATMARSLVERKMPARLVIEGGATAFATLRLLGWQQFSVSAQLARGVVELLTPQGVSVVLKPGSYPWQL